MKIIVNLPELEAEKEEFISRVASFHASLMIEKIKSLPIDDVSKSKLLKLVLEKLSWFSGFE